MGHVFHLAWYMNGVGFGDSSRTSVPKIMASDPPVGGGRISSVEGVTVGAPRAAQRVFAVPLVPAVVFTPSASVFPPPKFGGVTDVH